MKADIINKISGEWVIFASGSADISAYLMKSITTEEGKSMTSETSNSFSVEVGGRVESSLGAATVEASLTLGYENS